MVGRKLVSDIPPSDRMLVLLKSYWSMAAQSARRSLLRVVKHPKVEFRSS